TQPHEYSKVPESTMASSTSSDESNMCLASSFVTKARADSKVIIKRYNAMLSRAGDRARASEESVPASA
ncbi:MAG: hypothetical protein KDI66_23365, partial [Xanthomonadales bacterium]|nr:hypothetical protein [Xanthomonadales bacterium]